MKTDDLLDRSGSFEQRLRDGLNNLAHADPVSEPGRFDPDVLRIDRPSVSGSGRWMVGAAAAAVVAIGVGGLLVVDRDASAPNAPADQPVTGPDTSNADGAAITAPPNESDSVESAVSMPAPAPVAFGTEELCDDSGCDNFDPLALAPGAATYYRSDSATAHGAEATDLDLFTHLTRCAELTPDGTACARIEGIAGVSVVTYGGSQGSPLVEIGTTYATITPAQYAANWGPTGDGPGDTSPVVVRGHDGVRYANEIRDAVVWQEAPGVLIWVAVDPSLSDDLLELAEGVQPADPANVPATIPHRVVVPGLGEPWEAEDNDGDGVIVGVHDGIECVGFGYIDHCGTELENRVVVRTAGDSIRVSGSTPADVVKVRVTTSPEVEAVGDTITFAPYQSRFFSLVVASGDSLSVEWLNDSDQVIDSAVLTDLVTGIDAGTGPTTTVTANTVPGSNGLVIALVDASGTPGTAAAIAADLTQRGYVVVSTQTATQTFDESMLMPVETPSDGSNELLTVLGIGGFDTWTPTLIETSLAETVTDVVVIGTGGLPAMTPPPGTVP